MVHKLLHIAPVVMLLGILGVSDAHASTRVFVQIGRPAPIVAPVAVAAPYGTVWQPGYYVWTGFRYRWVPGAWVRRPYARGRWERDRWDRDRRYWDRDRRGDRNRDRDRDGDRNWDRERDYRSR